MVVNAHGKPLCKHARAAQRYGSPYYGGGQRWCTWWCTWRTLTYYVIVPSLLVIGLLITVVPRSMMDGFQYSPIVVTESGH